MALSDAKRQRPWLEKVRDPGGHRRAPTIEGCMGDCEAGQRTGGGRFPRRGPRADRNPW